MCIGKKITKEEMKKIQINILDDVSKFCDENNIKYWIDCGTLLGAIRHKGYIPWDDDIDIGMLREDYDKFIKLYNSKKSKYKLKCIELDKTYEYPFGKVIDTDTILYEPDEKGIKIAINNAITIIEIQIIAIGFLINLLKPSFQNDAEGRILTLCSFSASVAKMNLE